MVGHSYAQCTDQKRGYEECEKNEQMRVTCVQYSMFSEDKTLLTETEEVYCLEESITSDYFSITSSYEGAVCGTNPYDSLGLLTGACLGQRSSQDCNHMQDCGDSCSDSSIYCSEVKGLKIDPSTCKWWQGGRCVANYVPAGLEMRCPAGAFTHCLTHFLCCKLSF